MNNTLAIYHNVSIRIRKRKIFIKNIFMPIFLMAALALAFLSSACSSGTNSDTGSDTRTSAPTAAFTFTPGTLVVSQTVAFTDTSTGSPTSWSWSFGDGSISTSQNPTHAYSVAGTFTVTLTAGNATGSTSVSWNVIINPTGTAYAASFTFAPGAPVIAQTITFTDASTGSPTSWSWSFGDGSTSTFQNPTHAYSATGSFTVTLTASNATGSYSASQNVIVSKAGTAPGAAFTFTPTTPVTSQTITFTDASTGSPTSWSWSFGDGSTGTSQNPTHAYSAAGSFTVTLAASNVTGSSSVSHTVIVSKAGTAPSAAFTFTPSAPVTAQTIIFTDTSTGSPTSWSWNFGDGSTSTAKNPTHAYSAASSFTVTLTAGNATGSNTVSHSVTVSSAGSTPKFTMAQTISDGAQRTTLAFDGLAMMTGNLEAQSFFPPGKVADYTGFQYLRDNDPDNMGHNTSFLTRVANNVIYILNDSQFTDLKKLASSQQDQINLYGYKRYPLMKAFRRLLEGDIPSGSSGLNLNAVKKASRELYAIDGQISFERALLYANIIQSLDSTQLAYLNAMKGKGWNSWPDITNDQIKSKMQGLPQGTGVAVMTYASDLFSWYAGSLEADVYFCPERHGTYYGGFYIKDAPAVGHEGYSISEQLTAEAGRVLLTPNVSPYNITNTQASTMNALVNTQRNNLYAAGTNSIVGIRTQIATLLRSLLVSTVSSAEVNTQVLALSGSYGDLDGENNWNYAKVFTQVYSSLTADQKTALAGLRQEIMSGTYSDGTPFDFTVCTTPFLYSSVISDVSVLTQYIGNTDYLFFEP